MQSSNQIITTNKPTSGFLQAGCPSCRPTNSVKALKGKYHITWTCLPQAHLGVFQLLSLTTNSSWLPWGRVAMPLISPLMPVPRIAYCSLKFCFMPLNMQSATCIITSGPTSVLSVTHDLVFCPRVVILAR